MIVVIDTNIFVQDFWMQGTFFKVFLDELQVIPAKVYIPEVVVDEVINKYNEKLTEIYNQRTRADLEISKFLNKVPTIANFNIEQYTEIYKFFLIKKLKQIKAKILPYPQIDHKKIVKKIFEKKKPFKKGDAGYRDFLIWETIRYLDLNGTEQISFITNNSKDFGQGLLLKENFTDKITTKHNMTVFPSLNNFNEVYIMPSLRKLDVINEKVSKKIDKFNFLEFLNNTLLGLLKDYDNTSLYTPYPDNTGSVSLNEIILFKDYQILEVNELTVEGMYLKFEVECDIEITVNLDWDDYCRSEIVRRELGEDTEPFTFISWNDKVPIKVKGLLTLEKDTFKVSSETITYIETEYNVIAVF